MRAWAVIFSETKTGTAPTHRLVLIVGVHVMVKTVTHAKTPIPKNSDSIIAHVISAASSDSANLSSVLFSGFHRRQIYDVYSKVTITSLFEKTRNTNMRPIG